MVRLFSQKTPDLLLAVSIASWHLFVTGATWAAVNTPSLINPISLTKDSVASALPWKESVRGGRS